MRKYVLVVFCVFFVTSSFAQEKEDERLKESYTVLKEIIATPDKGIPSDLLAKAVCAVVYPSVKKAAFMLVMAAA
jgi:lipid-binding SYLF domain-containing protein